MDFYIDIDMSRPPPPSPRMLLRWTSITTLLFLLFRVQMILFLVNLGLLGAADQHSAGCRSGIAAIFQPRLWNLIRLPGSDVRVEYRWARRHFISPTPFSPSVATWIGPNFSIQLWQASQSCGAEWLVSVRPDVDESGAGLQHHRAHV